MFWTWSMLTGTGSLQLLKMMFWVIWCLTCLQKAAYPFCASPAKSSLVLLPEQKLLLILTEALNKTYCCMILWRQSFLVVTLALWYYPVCKAIYSSLPLCIYIQRPCASESPSSSTKVQLWIQPSSSTLKIMVAESSSSSSGLPLCQVQQKSVSFNFSFHLGWEQTIHSEFCLLPLSLHSPGMSSLLLLEGRKKSSNMLKLPRVKAVCFEKLLEPEELPPVSKPCLTAQLEKTIRA